MRVLLLSLLLSVTSCSFNQHEAKSISGNWEKDTNLAFGGTGSAKGADGSSWTYDNQMSAKDFFQAVGSLATAYAYGYAKQAKEITSRLASQGATQAQIAKIKADAATQAATLSARSGATDSAIKAGAPLGQVNVNPP